MESFSSNLLRSNEICLPQTPSPSSLATAGSTPLSQDAANFPRFTRDWSHFILRFGVSVSISALACPRPHKGQSTKKRYFAEIKDVIRKTGRKEGNRCMVDYIHLVPRCRVLMESAVVKPALPPAYRRQSPRPPKAQKVARGP